MVVQLNSDGSPEFSQPMVVLGETALGGRLGADPHDQLASVDDRLNYLKTIAESADKLKNAADKLKVHQTGLVDHTGAQDDGTMKERIRFLEEFSVACLQEHQKHVIFSQTQRGYVDNRLESLEALIGDKTDTHAKELEVAKEKLRDLDNTIVDCAKHGSVEERMNSFEKFVGEAMAARLESLEASENKHAKEIEAANNKLRALGNVIVVCAKHDQLASVEECLNTLRKSLDESADKLTAHQTTHCKHEESMRIRLESIEALIENTANKHAEEIAVTSRALGENEDKHVKEIEVAKAKLEDWGNHNVHLEERMNSLEKCLAVSADNLRTYQMAHGENEESMKSRLDSLEITLDAVLGDGSDKYAKAVEIAKEKLGGSDDAVVDCDRHDQLAIVEERVASLEKLLAESADKLNTHEAAHGEHKESMVLLGEHADKYTKEVDVAKEKLGLLDKTVVDCVRHDQLAIVEERMVSLEKSLAESVDKLQTHQMAYDEHEQSMKIRLESLLALIGDNSDTHAKDVEVTKEKLGDLDKAFVDWAKHSVIQEERMNSLENSVAESAGEPEELMKSRLEPLEALIGDIEDKYAKEFKIAKEKLEDFDKAFLGCAKYEQLAIAEEHLYTLAKSVAESADKLNFQQTAQVEHDESMKSRLASLEITLEAVLGDGSVAADKYAKEVEVAKEKLAALDAAFVDWAKHNVDQLACVSERMNSLEKALAESTDKLNAHQTVHGEHEESMALLGHNTDKYAKEVKVANEKLVDLDKSVVDCAKHDQIASVEERMNSLEESLAETLKTHQAAHGEREETMKIRLESLETLMRENQEKSFADSGQKLTYTSDEERRNSLEKSVSEAMAARLEFLEASQDKHAKEIEIALEKLGDLGAAIPNCAKHDQVEERINSCLSVYQAFEKFVAESLATRLSSLEASIGDNSDKYAKELDVAKKKLRDLGKAIHDCAKHDEVEERMNSLEKAFAEATDKLSTHQRVHGEHEESMVMLGDNADKYAKEFTITKDKLGDLDTAVVDCVRHDQLAIVEERVASLEKLLAESADKLKTHEAAHGEQKESMVLLGEHADKYTKEVDVAKEKLGLLDKTVVDCVRHDQLAIVEERVASIQKSLAESADKLKTHEAAHGEHKESMVLLGENADKCTKEVYFAKEKLGVLDKAFADCVKHNANQLAIVEERMASLENSRTESADKLKTHEAAHGEHEMSMALLGDLAKSFVDCVKHGQLASVEERMNALEKSLAESGKLTTPQMAHGDHEESMKIRLESLEALIGQHANKHAEEIAVTSRRLGGLEIQLFGFEERMRSFEEFVAADKLIEARLESLEASISDISDECAKEFASAKRKFEDLEKAFAKCAKQKVGDLDKAFVECAKPDTLATLASLLGRLDERMNAFDQIAGEAEESQGYSAREESKTLDGDTPSTIVDSSPEDILHLSIDQRVERRSSRQICSTFDAKVESNGEIDPGRVETGTLLARTQDDEGHTRRRLDFEECQSPSQTFALLLQDLQGGSVPKDSKALLGDTLSTAIGEAQSPQDVAALELTLKAELQSENKLDIHNLEWLPAHRMDRKSGILGSWSYKDGAFSIHEAVNTLRLLFSQHDFTGELEHTDDWLQVYIPEAKGSIRMQIDRTGNYLRVQFRRDDEARWHREVRAEKNIRFCHTC